MEIELDTTNVELMGSSNFIDRMDEIVTTYQIKINGWNVASNGINECNKNENCTALIESWTFSTILNYLQT